MGEGVLWYYVIVNFKLSMYSLMYSYVDGLMMSYFIQWVLIGDKMFQVHVLLSLPQPQTEPFLQGALVPGSWTGYVEAKIWVLSRLMATGVSLLPGPFAYPHIHTHLQPYLFLFSTYANCKPGVHTGTFPSNPTPQGSFWLLPFHFPNCLKPGFHHPCIFTYLTNAPI